MRRKQGEISSYKYKTHAYTMTNRMRIKKNKILEHIVFICIVYDNKTIAVVSRLVSQYRTYPPTPTRTHIQIE